MENNCRSGGRNAIKHMLEIRDAVILKFNTLSINFMIVIFQILIIVALLQKLRVFVEN